MDFLFFPPVYISQWVHFAIRTLIHLLLSTIILPRLVSSIEINYWILLSNKVNILLPILKIKRSSYHIFTQNKQKLKLDGYWNRVQSTLYECSLKVLYNLGFQSSITKRNKARVLPLVYAMSTSTKNRHACLLLDQMKPGKRL